jgi:hypothetical protein
VETEDGVLTDPGPTPSEIRNYIDQYATSILVRVKLGNGWRDLSISALDPAERERVTIRLIEYGYFPHRILVL